MESFNISFRILSIFGLWKPINCITMWEKTFYKVYGFVFIPLPYLLDIGLMARMILADISFEQLSETLFMFMTTTNACLKSINFLYKRKQLISLTEMLSCKWAIPQSNEETIIQTQCNSVIRSLTWKLIILVECTVALWLIIPFFQVKNHRTLPFDIWLPCNISEDRIFWVVYVPDALAIVSISFISIANDSMITGLMLIACHQFDLLIHRFNVLSKSIEKIKENNSECDITNYEKKLMAENILHHKFIFEFTHEICQIFSSVILTQFIISSLIISVTVYQLSSSTVGVEFFVKLLFLTCMLVEFFIYCWFGNELTLKSVNFSGTVFNINWMAMSKRSKEKLLFLSLRAMKPIIISNGYFIVLSLDSFTKILKTSYTAFNLIRTSRA